MSNFNEIVNDPRTSIKFMAHCGGFLCTNMVEVKNPELPQPEIFICSSCQEKMDVGIIRWLHANTGKLRGGFHLTDGYKE